MRFLLLLLTFFFVCPESSSASSANNTNVDKFYRPAKSNDLVTKLAPRIDHDKLLDGNSALFTSENGGCPEQILIGSVDEDADIFGDVDIDVYIGNDVFIDCGGL